MIMKKSLFAVIILTIVLSINASAEFAITSIDPNEGSIFGGTTITIKLSDTPSDIVLPLIFRIGNVPCTLKEAKFTEGKLDYAIIKTGAHETGDVDIELTITSKSSGNIVFVKKNAFKYIPAANISELPAESKTVYKKPKEDTVEWLLEAKKGEKILWQDPWEDLFNNKPGDSWNDYQKYYEFTLAGIAGYGAFMAFASKDNLLEEARLKAFSTVSIIVIATEIIGSVTADKSHFCTKNIVAGMTGAAFGGVILTLPLH